MLARIATSLPLQAVDALFVRSLMWLSPRVRGDSCEVCANTVNCGQCQCPGRPPWCLGTYHCDSCGTGIHCDDNCHGCPPGPGSGC